jgi:CRISPR-associated protein Cmr1
MQLCRYNLCFQTPAFLGNAQQQAQWRTPPIKALLRQWGRVAAAQELRYDVTCLREREAALFGTAADDGGQSTQSRIRIRLGAWEMGQLKPWPSHGKVPHPEVKSPVGGDLYLGYGPLVFQGGATALKNNAAIQAGSSIEFRLAFPESDAPALLQALALMDRYGTLGGRSRNGWGSFTLEPADAHTDSSDGAPPLRDWQQALQLDWPHALGHDAQGALIWQTRPVDDWKALMKQLATLKIKLRTQPEFRFPHARPDGQIHDRHWLSYPVTTHKVWAWDKNNARLPNSLRFKVRPAPGNSNRVVGVIFHVPCKPPPAFDPDIRTLTAVWQKVHDFLDAQETLTRIPA